jgi:hypothetical protein
VGNRSFDARRPAKVSVNERGLLSHLTARLRRIGYVDRTFSNLIFFHFILFPNRRHRFPNRIAAPSDIKPILDVRKYPAHRRQRASRQTIPYRNVGRPIEVGDIYRGAVLFKQEDGEPGSAHYAVFEQDVRSQAVKADHSERAFPNQLEYAVVLTVIAFKNFRRPLQSELAPEDQFQTLRKKVDMRFAGRKRKKVRRLLARSCGGVLFAFLHSDARDRAQFQRGILLLAV